MELLRSTSRGGFSVRGILTFVLAVVITALLWATFGSATTHAAPTDPGNWNGESILYNGHQYFKIVGDAKAGESHGLAQGTHYYVYVEVISERPLQQKAHVIYFAPGSDPPTLQSAEFVTYNYSATRVYSNPQDKRTITMNPQGTTDNFATSCSVEGVGWIICPVSVFLANAMDWLFDILSGLIAVQPLATTDTRGDLYTAWNVMRSIANVAFIIAFLVIIYSQLTSLGISNYGLKKLLPRLIIAAILVNVSFFICALAVDISNVSGYALQDLMVSIREHVFNIDNDTWSAATTDWRAVTAFVLSGGTAAFAGIAIATYGSATSAIFLLILMLVGVLLAALFVVIILAARQAIIILLIIIAPLAFVANLLPNTEKWFEKWRDLFMTMLVFFPAFSLVFGGSQLAGGIILMNANSIVMIIFGLAVQVAPLAITPLLLKLSGGLLGRVAGIINDPRKGLMDRTKTWANDRAEMYKYRSLGKPTHLNPFRAAAKRMHDSNERVKGYTEDYKTRNTLRYQQTPGYRRLHRQEAGTNLIKERIESQNKGHIQAEINSVGSDLHLEYMRTEDSKAALEYRTEETTKMVKEYKSGRVVRTGELDLITRRLKENTILTAAEKQGAQSADYVIQQNVSTVFTQDTVASRALVRVAGSVDPNGRIRARANATAALGKLEKEGLDNSVILLNSEAIQRGTTLKAYALQVIERERNPATAGAYEPQVLDAALEAAAQDGQISILRKARMEGSNIPDDVLTKLFARNAPTMKAKGGFDLQANPGLAKATPHDMNLSIAATLGDYSADKITEIKNGFLVDIANPLDGFYIGNIINDVQSEPDAAKRGNARAALRNTYLQMTEAIRNDDVRNGLGSNLAPTLTIHEQLQRYFGDADKVIDYNKYR